MKEENAIEVKDITKTFKVYLDRSNNVKDFIIHGNRRRYEKRQVLKGISFEVKKGEAVGLIGHNGCGKSTTLKLLTKIMYPDSGSIEMKGRVSSLIELGAGFHPDMSGRENIYINASIFGLSKKEIDRRIGEIIAFSELEEFIDNPVRTYSSGMYMRLAFSVAINVDADILLIDEILAVGDIAFQAKCFNKLKEVKAEGTTIVIVSHSLGQIEQICERSIWIHEGKIREEGSPRVVDPKYMAYMSQKNSEKEKKAEEVFDEKSSGSQTDKADTKERVDEKEKSNRWGSREVVMDKVMLLDSEGKERRAFQNDEPVCIRIHYTAARKIEDAVLGIALYRSDQMYIYGTNTLIDFSEAIFLENQGVVDLLIDRIPLNAGSYSVDLAIHRPDGFNYDFWQECCMIDIMNEKSEVGVISLPHTWQIK